MIRQFLATTALCSVPLVAAAADLPVKAPIQKAPMVPAFSWTGFYAGGNVGYSWGRSDVSFEELSFLSFGLRPDGIIGGLQAGYNWQFDRNWVFGLEADFQWTGQKDSRELTADISGPCLVCDGGTVNASYSYHVGSKLSWLGTLRGRIGFVPDPLPRSMFYATGGLAYGRVKTSLDGSLTATFSCDCGFDGEGISSQILGSHAKTKLGFAVGAGMEHVFSNRWTWKIEYLYVDLGKVSGNMPTSGSCTTFGGLDPSFCNGIGGAGVMSYSNKMTDHILRVGLNYKFTP